MIPLCEFAADLCPVLKYCCHLNVGDGFITVFVPPLCQLIVPFDHISAVLIAHVDCSGISQRSVLLLSRVYS